MTRHTLLASPESRRPKRRALLRALCGSLLAGFSRAFEAHAQTAPAYRVLVHPHHPASEADRDLLLDLFLKRSTRWEHGALASPVDLPATSPARRAFSLAVLKRPVSAVRNYWTQRIFAGRDVPPPEVESEAAVVKFVATHPGAVGYVSPGTDIAGTKVLGVR